MSDDKPRRWLDLLAGVLSGQLAVGSRTPVIDTPAWVTLEVLHGGFATGRYLAEVPPDDHERTVLDGLPVDAPGDTEREKLNRWYLTEDGRRDLVAAVRAGRYRITVPEEAALAVVAVLVEKGLSERALDLVGELRLFLPRLKLTPSFTGVE